MTSFKKEITKLAEDTVLTNEEIAKVVGCSFRTVRRYAGSFSERCRPKSWDKGNIFEVKKVVLLPDIHYPHYEKTVLDVVNEFIADYDPDELVYMGDQISLDSISSWNRHKPLLKEGQRLLKDYENFNRDILVVHEKITRPDIQRTFMIGNHEQRVRWFCEEHPELSGLIDLERYLRLEERSYSIIPFNQIYQIAKLSVIHGYYYNKYHSAKTLDVFEGNVVYAHVHNPQMYAKVSPIDKKGYHTATGLGCLCNIAPEYKRGMPTTWINQFAVLEYLPATGNYNLFPITIVDGSFMWNGKYYGKKI